MEQQIRNRAMKDAESLSKEQKKHLNLYKEWRKGLTGVLIDLHWLRILGANSKILAMNTQMLGKAFGYLIDMALLPLVPAMVQFTKYVIGVAKWIRQLPQPARLLVAGLAALAIGVTTLGTILMYATSALTAFSAAVTAATAAETAKAGQTTLATLGMFGVGGAAIGGSLAAGVGIGAVAGLAGVWVLLKTGVLDAISGIGRAIESSPLGSVVMDALKIILAPIGSLGAGIIALVQGDFARIPEVMIAPFEQAGEAIGRNIDRIRDAFSGIGTVVTGGVQALGGAVNSMVQSFAGMGSIGGYASAAFGNIGGAFNAMAGQVRGVFSQMFSGILGLIQSTAGGFYNAGMNIITSIVNGIVAAAGGIVTAIANALSAVRALFPFSPAKEGPLAETPNWGTWMSAGMESAAPEVAAAAETNLAAPAAAGVAGGMAGAGEGAGLGLGILNEKLLGTGPKATWNRYALISKLFGKDIPLMQEGGIATKPTMGIFGEGGAEAIIPLSKIGEVMGGILGAGASFANTLTQAATGGGGVGGGLNMGGGTGATGGLLVKGFSWVAMSVNEGFKINNKLLAAILALLAQFGGGGGGSSKETETRLRIPFVSFAETAWAAITALAQAVWNEILSIAKGVWDAAYTLAVDAWNNIVTFATGVWDKITQIGGQAWTAITTKAIEIWDTISIKAGEIWETIKVFADDTFNYIKEGFTTVIGAILSIIPGRPEGEIVPTPTPTGPEGVGGGGGGTPIFEGLQKVFHNGVYIGDWELYSDGTKKWRPNPNISELAGTTAPPTGAGTVSPGQASAGGASAYGAYITEGADNYAKTINTALQKSSNIVTTIVPESTTSFTDVFVSAVTGVGNMIWNGLTDAAETVYDVVTGAASAVGDAAISAITTANNWLSSTFGGIGRAVGIPALPFIPPVVAAMATGGSITSNGLAFLHKGETVIPAAGVDRGNAGGGVTINNPTFVISGRTERELFENFMRMMKSESARVL